MYCWFSDARTLHSGQLCLVATHHTWHTLSHVWRALAGVVWVDMSCFPVAMMHGIPIKPHHWHTHLSEMVHLHRLCEQLTDTAWFRPQMHLSFTRGLLPSPPKCTPFRTLPLAPRPIDETPFGHVLPTVDCPKESRCIQRVGAREREQTKCCLKC